MSPRSLLGAVLLLVGVAGTVNPGEAQNGDSVVGGGFILAEGVQLSIHARSGPNGENPEGVFFVSLLGGHQNGDQKPDFQSLVDVLCVMVDGNRAAVGGVIREPETQSLPFFGFYVEDNGGGHDLAALNNFHSGEFTSNQDLCVQAVLRGVPNATALTGHVIVTDK